MRSIVRAVLVLSVFVVASAAFARSPPPADAVPTDPRVVRFLELLEADRETLKIPGMSVAILADGGELWLGGRGFADLEQRVPATADTPYPIASVTKTFTAVIAHRLVEQGKLDLEAEVRQWVPEVADPRVRVKHLLSHTSVGEAPGTYFGYNPDRFEHLKKIL